MDTKARSLIKGLTWRISASFATLLLVYVFTGNIVISASISILEVAFKLLLYYSHERIWNVVKWGRNGRVINNSKKIH
jgi:uncharacterized membrane protein